MESLRVTITATITWGAITVLANWDTSSMPIKGIALVRMQNEREHCDLQLIWRLITEASVCVNTWIGFAICFAAFVTICLLWWTMVLEASWWFVNVILNVICANRPQHGFYINLHIRLDTIAIKFPKQTCPWFLILKYFRTFLSTAQISAGQHWLFPTLNFAPLAIRSRRLFSFCSNSVDLFSVYHQLGGLKPTHTIDPVRSCWL